MISVVTVKHLRKLCFYFLFDVRIADLLDFCFQFRPRYRIFCLCTVHAARTEVKQCLFIEFSDCRAVASLYVFLCTEDHRNRLVDYIIAEQQYLFCLCSDGICRTAHKVDCAAEDLFRRIHQRSVCLDRALGYFSEVAHIQIDIKFLLILQKIADFCLQ